MNNFNIEAYKNKKTQLENELHQLEVDIKVGEGTIASIESELKKLGIDDVSPENLETIKLQLTTKLNELTERIGPLNG